MLKLSIPVPCHQNWDAMLPNNLGRHCESCQKTVVDFTTMDDEQIKNYFIDRKDENVCGRLTRRQLNRIVIKLPNNIIELQMPVWKRFLLACLIIFSTTLFSCEVKTDGPSTTMIGLLDFRPSMESDTIPVSSSTPDTIDLITKPFCSAVISDSIEIQGVIQMVPEIPVAEPTLSTLATPDTVIEESFVGGIMPDRIRIKQYNDRKRLKNEKEAKKCDDLEIPYS